MPSNQSEPGSRSAKWFFLVIGVAIAYLYTSLFSLGGTPYFRTGDEDFFWAYGCRLLSGQVFLRDFHQFTPPGIDLVYAAVFHLYGSGVRSTDCTILCLGVALAIACFFCARTILPPDMAALAALLCLVVLYGDRMDATHHWFSSLANLLAIMVLSRGRSWGHIAGAAALIAVSAFFTQTRGAVGLLACCAGLWWDRHAGQVSLRTLWSRLAVLIGVTFGVWLALSWRFIAEAGLGTYWFEQVAYLPKDANFPEGFLIPDFRQPDSMRGWFVLADRVVMYLLLLVVCPWVLSLCLRLRAGAREKSLMLFLLASLGVLQMLEVIHMLNWNRMAAVGMPSIILGVWLVSRLVRAKQAATAVCWCVMGGMMVAQSAATLLHHYARVDFPTGSALVEKADAEELEWLVKHTRPGDCFFEVSNTRLYATFELRNPTPVPVLSTRVATLPQWVDESVRGLEQCRTPYILWEPQQGIGRVEERHQVENDYLDELKAYMQGRYTPVEVFKSGSEIWGRKDLAGRE